MNIKRECEALIDNNLLDAILFYYQEYPEQKKEFADELISALRNTLTTVEKEMEEGRKAEIQF